MTSQKIVILATPAKEMNYYEQGKEQRLFIEILSDFTVEVNGKNFTIKSKYRSMISFLQHWTNIKLPE